MEGQVSDRRIYREGLKNKKKVIEERVVDGAYLLDNIFVL